ncbi:sulfite exporter TauE/SafE family protein [Oceaniserpentilla sp. 4NH20-0058]|uniref:sulfite exporter TauE/SafE family protein n=1 Tax=Oceaniserpentilla sp. 4NH20-0058 TaxID=3127660 RepID=UPI00310B5916
MLDQIILFLISTVANIFSAFAGGGAGLIQLPVLIFMGLPFSVALATHKVATVALGLGATIRNVKEGHTSWRLNLFMLASGIPGVVLGAYIIIGVNDRYAEIALGIMTLGLSLYSLFKPNLGLEPSHKNRDLSGLILGGVGLAVIGFANGALSAGTGLFATMWLVKWFGLNYKQAVGHTLIAVGLFWNASGALTMGFIAQIQWDWLAALVLGSLVGGFVGAHLAIKMGSGWIKRVYEVITLIVGIKLIVG